MSACFWAIVTPTFRRLLGLSSVFVAIVVVVVDAVMFGASSASDATDWSDFLFLPLGGMLKGNSFICCKKGDKRKRAVGESW